MTQPPTIQSLAQRCEFLENELIRAFGHIDRAHQRIDQLEKEIAKTAKTAKTAADALNQANAARHWTP